MATVYQFPRIRDRAYIRKQAAWLASLSPATAEKQLARQLDVQRQTMLRRGVAADIEAELRQIEAVIRCEMCRFRLTGGAA